MLKKYCESTYSNFYNIKLRQGYFFANITKFSEQLLCKTHSS